MGTNLKSVNDDLLLGAGRIHLGRFDPLFEGDAENALLLVKQEACGGPDAHTHGHLPDRLTTED